MCNVSCKKSHSRATAEQIFVSLSGSGHHVRRSDNHVHRDWRKRIQDGRIKTGRALPDRDRDLPDAATNLAL